MKNKISKILISVGLLVLVGSFTLSLYSKYTEKQALNNFEDKIQNQEVINKANPGDEIGIIEIDSVDLKSVIVHSTEKQYLKYYVCQFEESVVPGEEGNFSIAGHSGYMYNQVFNNLHKVKIGEEIKIRTVNNEFIYTITDIKEVEPDETYVLDHDMSKREITIVTCTNGGKQRFIVKGEIM